VQVAVGKRAGGSVLSSSSDFTNVALLLSVAADVCDSAPHTANVKPPAPVNMYAILAGILKPAADEYIKTLIASLISIMV
jgi:hypothetical protein